MNEQVHFGKNIAMIGFLLMTLMIFRPWYMSLVANGGNRERAADEGSLGAPFALSFLMSRTEHFFRDKVVLITGASSGIGEELAWQLSQAGAKLTLAARRAELLQALAERIAAAQKPRPLVVACDVTRDGDLERAVAETVRHWGKLDVAIANAGFGVVGAAAKAFA